MITTLLRSTLAALALADGIRQGAEAPQAQKSLRFEPYTLQGPGDQAVEAEVGLIVVPERRGRPGRTIELGFVRLPSLTPSSRPPVVYLDGGPGGSGLGAARAPHLFAVFQALRQQADVILLSQRGTGLSKPRLTCPGGAVPTTFYASRAMMTEAMLPRGKACAELWRHEGVDLGAFNTEESADDVDDLRRHLGAERISLLGFSYGTHLALATIRRHERHIARAVLLGTEGPDDTWKPPLAYDLQVRRIADLVAEDPVAGKVIPDLHAVLRDVLAALERAPVAVPVQLQGEPVTLTLGADGLRYLLAQDIGDTNDIPSIVRGIHEASRGDYRSVGRLMQRRYSAMAAGGGNLMSIAMDCASGASPSRLAKIRDQEGRSLFGRMIDYPFPDACAALDLPALGDEFRLPVAARTPVLFVSGTLDANTPPYQAERVRWGFPRSAHIVVANAGHESTLGPAAVREAIVRFISGAWVVDTAVAGPALRFTLAEAP